MSADSPDVVVICDFPPSNLAGSPVVLRRLLDAFPGVEAVVAGSYYLRASDRASFLPVPHISVPMLPPGGRAISKIIKAVLRPLFFTAAALGTGAAMFRRRRAVAVSVAYGSLFVLAAVFSRLWRQKSVLFVHDDWHGALSRNGSAFWRRTFAWVLRHTDRVIVISGHLQSRIRQEFSTESTVFMAARTLPAKRTTLRQDNGAFNLTYLGSLNSVVRDVIEFVAAAVKSGTAEKAMGRPVHFRLFTKVPEKTKREWGLVDPHIDVLPWVAEEKVDETLAEADALLLPFSFRSEDRSIVTTSFPSKTADYLASGVPIVTVSPSWSTIAEYIRETRAAFLVESLDEREFAAALAEIGARTERTRDICTHAAHALRANHDIAFQRQTLAAMIRELSNAAG